MKRTIASLAVVGLGLLGATVSAHAAPPGKITICHATSSETNPYVAETISLSALSAHVGDTEDIVPANSGNDMPNGQNLTPENIALLNNGCVAVVPVDPVEDPVDPPVDPVDQVDSVEPVDPVDPPVDPVDPPVDPVDPPVDPVDPVVDPPVDPVDPVHPVDPVVDPVDPVVPPVVVPPADTVVVPVTPVVPGAATVVGPAVNPVVTPAVPVARTGTGTGAIASNVGYNVQTAAGGKPGTGIPAWLAVLTCLFAGVAAAVLWRSGVRFRKVHG